MITAGIKLFFGLFAGAVIFSRLWFSSLSRLG